MPTKIPKTHGELPMGSEFTPRKIPGRATEEHEKRQVMEKILAIWIQNPSLRLGQMLQNSQDIRGQNLFYTEDFKLAEDVVAFHKKFGQNG